MGSTQSSSGLRVSLELSVSLSEAQVHSDVQIKQNFPYRTSHGEPLTHLCSFVQGHREHRFRFRSKHQGATHSSCINILKYCYETHRLMMCFVSNLCIICHCPALAYAVYKKIKMANIQVKNKRHQWRRLKRKTCFHISADYSSKTCIHFYFGASDLHDTYLTVVSMLFSKYCLQLCR